MFAGASYFRGLMMTGKTGVLLLQLGTPDSPSTGHVRRYLREFLTDPRVIDLPWLQRQLLVNVIIAPFRAPKSAKLYKEIWTKEGSPLLLYGLELAEKLQQQLGDAYIVTLGMRYRKPSIRTALKRFEAMRINKLVLVPLFPQFASSSTGSALQEALETLAKWEVIPQTQVISGYFDNPGYIRLWIEKGRAFQPEIYDRVMFTFHGVPWRHIRTSGCRHQCQQGPRECPAIDEKNHTCYRAQCFANARAVRVGLGIPEEKTDITFQSRLGNDPWLTPYTDKTLIRYAEEGHRKVLVFSMSFTADCLETIYEMSVENQHLFKQHGGEKVQLVPSLNTDAGWVDFLKALVMNR